MENGKKYPQLINTVNNNQSTITPKIYVLTISDRSYSGTREDLGGPAVIASIQQLTGWEITSSAIVPDETKQISDKLIEWTDSYHANLILTTGGTGLSARDVTPEATLKVIDRQVPGIIEAIRSSSLKITPYSMLSRAIAGTRQQCLIINLPGNPKAAHETLTVIAPVLPHALEIMSITTNPNDQHSRLPYTNQK